jgi:phosphoglycolate phosphatase
VGIRRAVLFDLDGTLTDPKPGITACLAYALNQLGVPSNPDDLTWCIGPPLALSFPRLLNTNDPGIIARAIELYRERFSTVGMYENAVYPGVPECLAQLQEAEVELYVATSKPHVYAEPILAHFGLRHFFHAVHGSELDGRNGDKGELIAHLLACETLESNQAIMVGDREHDMIGARKNGVSAVGVTYGYGSREELDRSGACTICDYPGQLAENLLQRLPES